MAYTVFASSDWDPEAPLTTGKMSGLYGNFAGLAAGDTGAPPIQNAAMDVNSVGYSNMISAAIHQAELSTTEGQVGGTISAGTTNYQPPGGEYAFAHHHWTDDYINSTMRFRGPIGNSLWQRVVEHINGGSGSIAMFTKHRYIDASRPYDLGDGEIRQFIFAMIDNSDPSIKSLYVAQDAPWHYNGPTDIRPTRKARDGRLYQNRKDMRDFSVTLRGASSDPILLQQYKNAFTEAQEYEIEITQEVKNADMNLIPHPFIGNDLSNKTVVLIDPVSDLVSDIDEMKAHNDFNAIDVILKYVKIENVPLTRSGPPGVAVVNARWKNTWR